MTNQSIASRMLVKRIKNAYVLLLDFLFPNFCISCDTNIYQGILCRSCSSELEVIDPSNRCIVCFSDLSLNVCNCKNLNDHMYKQAFVCEKEGVAFYLSKHYPENMHIQKIIGSLFTIQICKLKWPHDAVYLSVDSHNKTMNGIIEKIKEFVPIEAMCCTYSYRLTCKSTGLDFKKRLNLHSKCFLSDKECIIMSVDPFDEISKKEIHNELVFKGIFKTYFLSFYGLS